MLRHDMPGISIDTKPCFLAQTHFRLSHSALQYYFLSHCVLLLQGDMGSKLYFLYSCTLPRLCEFVLLLFSLLNASWILWSEILLANITSSQEKQHVCGQRYNPEIQRSIRYPSPSTLTGHGTTCLHHALGHFENNNIYIPLRCISVNPTHFRSDIGLKGSLLRNQHHLNKAACPFEKTL